MGYVQTVFGTNSSSRGQRIPWSSGIVKVGRDCPQCGNFLVFRQGRYGKFIGCSTFPTCRYTEQILDKIGVSCPQDGGELVKRYTRKGKVFYSCANYPECDYRSWKRPVPDRCNNCGDFMILQNSHFAKCTKCGESQPLAKTAHLEGEMAGSD